jgi:ribonuclease HI
MAIFEAYFDGGCGKKGPADGVGPLSWAWLVKEKDNPAVLFSEVFRSDTIGPPDAAELHGLVSALSGLKRLGLVGKVYLWGDSLAAIQLTRGAWTSRHADQAALAGEAAAAIEELERAGLLIFLAKVDRTENIADRLLKNKPFFKRKWTRKSGSGNYILQEK